MVKNFFKSESAVGIVMIFSAALALIIANSPASVDYFSFLQTKLKLPFLSISVQHFVQDVMMVAFFFLIGLELKREMFEGFLTDRKQIMLPLVAAIGGMVVPAAIYLGINNSNNEAFNGWAIPSATDIAFAVCILGLVAKKISPAAKILLLAIAIFDDLGAIIIIALFYSKQLNLELLLVCGLIIGIMFLLNKYNFNKVIIYILLGLVLVALFYMAGIHTTVAGVITAFMIPKYKDSSKKVSLIKNLEKKIHYPVNFAVLPLFAFVSSGIDLRNLTNEMLFSGITMGVCLGLFLGKQLGIFGFTYAMVKFKFATKPSGVNWLDIYGVSILAGIGFTMSLFINALAFSDPVYLEEAKLGIILGSILSTILGAIVFKLGSSLKKA
ncbi:MAG TPA: Na+/H+ antiporter NhaA [Alphaproteobacteria bacterium]|nr:Na+/H+ antiporter NhaA [Alphaproteobacteria bacterium]